MKYNGDRWQRFLDYKVHLRERGIEPNLISAFGIILFTAKDEWIENLQRMCVLTLNTDRRPTNDSSR